MAGGVRLGGEAGKRAWDCWGSSINDPIKAAGGGGQRCPNRPKARDGHSSREERRLVLLLAVVRSSSERTVDSLSSRQRIAITDVPRKNNNNKNDVLLQRR